MRQKKSRQKSVVGTEKLGYLSLLSANVQTLKIGKTDLGPYFSNDEVKYIF